MSAAPDPAPLPTVDATVLVPVVVTVPDRDAAADPRGRRFWADAYAAARAALVPGTRHRGLRGNGFGHVAGEPHSGKRVLLVGEGTPRAYDVSSDDQLTAVCLALVREWYGPGGTRPDWEAVGPEPVPPDTGLSPEQVAALPARSVVRRAAERAAEEHRLAVQNWRHADMVARQIRRCLDAGDGWLAYRVVKGEHFDGGAGLVQVWDGPADEPDRTIAATPAGDAP